MDDKTGEEWLRSHFKNATSIDICVAYWNLNGWDLVAIPRLMSVNSFGWYPVIKKAIPRMARIRIIVGMGGGKTFRIGEANRAELEDLARRIHWGLCKIATRTGDHRKRYISRRGFRRAKVISGSGNFSRNGLLGEQKNDWNEILGSQARSYVRDFKKDWKSGIMKDVSKQTLADIKSRMAQINGEKWKPPEPNFLDSLWLRFLRLPSEAGK